ncbi:MAG: hypothetical protein QXE05_07245 [Nitrososphaeria archaeon]
MNVILSIKPKYCKMILSGVKKYEFRKKFPKDVKYVYIYATSPIKKLVGKFKVGEIIEGSPTELWIRFRKYGGIDEDEFFKYYKGASKGYAIQIEKVRTFSPIDPKTIMFDFKPPQSYKYTSDIFL